MKLKKTKKKNIQRDRIDLLLHCGFVVPFNGIGVFENKNYTELILALC